MPWVRIDEEFPDHPKVMKAGPLGIAMQVAALCYCNRYLTDGFVPRSAAAKLLDLSSLAEVVTWQLVIEDMENADLWIPVDGGWRIHGYHEYQPTRDTVEAKRVKEHKDKVAGGKARAAGANRDRGRFTKAQVSTSTTSSPPAAHQQPTSSRIDGATSGNSHSAGAAAGRGLPLSGSGGSDRSEPDGTATSRPLSVIAGHDQQNQQPDQQPTSPVPVVTPLRVVATGTGEGVTLGEGDASPSSATPSGDADSASPTPTRCRHRNDPTTCGICSDAIGQPPPRTALAEVIKTGQDAAAEAGQP